ncbi:hypothetical protein LG943_10495 [Streptomonospora sp. S1-112]|uniref:Uncharacterized protein n=1 Tax=Streptomonospora mangrovi TaxID=2883123 RepID=A0A9X3NMB4_9ACTN|nr:hypothetical protein [Streptomonospora mangrovi]MDA0564753.1 hypothetical protein [Streptomonospora mangrovi]
MPSRLRTLAVLELVNIPLFAVVLFGVLRLPPAPANLAGFALFALLLVEGSAYWWAKAAQVRSRSFRPAGLPLFRILRMANPVLLAAGGAVVAWGFAGQVPWTHVWPGAGLAVFALAEHVNYFHVQLSHQNRADLARLRRTRRPHRSHLARDLARSAKNSPPPP